MDACFAARLEALKIQARLNRCAGSLTACSDPDHLLDETLMRLRAELRVAALGTVDSPESRSVCDQPAAPAI